MLALTTAAGATNRALTKPLDTTQHLVTFNPTYDQLWAPIYGPSHPYAKDGLTQCMRNHKLGFVKYAEECAKEEDEKRGDREGVFASTTTDDEFGSDQAGYDKNIKYWDTKTGQVISAFSTGKILYVVRLNPDEDKQNILLKLASSAEFGQSDYSTRERFQLNRKKRFVGQIVAGYAYRMEGLSCREMVRVSAGFGTGRVAKSLELSSFMKGGYALVASGIRWNKVKWQLAGGTA
ncbi:hypothetical protein RHGRI_014327 [Rhododendron griersonianum]|uniref:Uncharacterized protein n=1 Tax=Rhododendron griersonianum TaxID=479676 RepID=A0AAV6K9H8_9ERIC|nr:hypothetical protein RHGRI_014327 [Rhododendron griersonianum]